ncbi:MAG TPA: glycoside hydrolase family 43 protein [Verrucomicrobiota bacterium]|nr:glycoside hydrolase family 43 protein [Verrucomicrobiota bacterium]
MAITTAASSLVPAYSDYFADPFVWKAGADYYAIGTGALEAEGCVMGDIFPVLHSRDFQTWTSCGRALRPPNLVAGTHFWAPEVAQFQNRFYLYYSVGEAEAAHQLRVAVGDHPAGPYHDFAPLLDIHRCPFAIDAHPFRDDDGQWYLFYARDFLDATPEYRAGTGLMVAKLRSMTELEDEGHPVLRPRCDWQRFEANRWIHGRRHDWHTIEGPCVRRHSGRYYCFYSGGRWENETYGVDYAVAGHVSGPYSDAGNEAGPRVLRTLAGTLIGPGHNSIVVGPDGREYMAFHAWDKDRSARRMFVRPLKWTRQGPRCEL